MFIARNRPRPIIRSFGLPNVLHTPHIGAGTLDRRATPRVDDRRLSADPDGGDLSGRQFRQRTLVVETAGESFSGFWRGRRRRDRAAQCVVSVARSNQLKVANLLAEARSRSASERRIALSPWRSGAPGRADGEGRALIGQPSEVLVDPANVFHGGRRVLEVFEFE